MIYLGPAGYQVGLDLWSIALLLAALAFFIAAMFKAGAPTHVLASALCIAGLATSTVVLARGIMAPEQSWVTMLGAIEEASGEARAERVRDLQENWHHREIRALAWFWLSHRWNVCHHLWQQQNCRLPITQEDSVGVAREILEEFVGNPPYQPPSRK